MRSILLGSSVLALAISLVACPNDLTGECVAGIEYTAAPQIIPDPSPFLMCAVDPEACAPANRAYGVFRIHNCGRQTLEISKAEVVTRDADVFAELTLEEMSIAPGAESIGRFLYTPTDTAEHHADLVFTSNAENFPELKVEVVVRANEADAWQYCSPIDLDAGSPDCE